MLHRPTLFAAPFLAMALAPAAAQTWLIDRGLEGQPSFEGQLAGLTVRDGAETWAFDVDGERRELRGPLFAAHGPALREAGSDRIWLVGGQLLRGDVRAGDPGGETVVLESPVFGRMPVYVDRLAEVQFGVGPGAPRLRLPSGVDDSEVLFLRARGGARDTVVGTVHQFGERAIMFARGDQPDPDRFDYGSVVALAVAGGLDAEAFAQPGTVYLVATRNGDRVHAQMLGFDAGAVRMRIENEREVSVPVGEIAALTRIDAVHLSDLQPISERERSYADDDSGVLHPVARDRAAATGEFLGSGGRTYAKGLGVHARSELTWRVPEGVSAFHAWVGFDRSTTALPLRPDADVVVIVDDREVFAWRGMRGGDAPRPTGRIEVTPGSRLTLLVDFGRGLDLGDRVHWLAAAFR